MKNRLLLKKSPVFSASPKSEGLPGTLPQACIADAICYTWHKKLGGIISIPALIPRTFNISGLIHKSVIFRRIFFRKLRCSVVVRRSGYSCSERSSSNIHPATTALSTVIIWYSVRRFTHGYLLKVHSHYVEHLSK